MRSYTINCTLAMTNIVCSEDNAAHNLSCSMCDVAFLVKCTSISHSIQCILIVCVARCVFTSLARNTQNIFSDEIAPTSAVHNWNKHTKKLYISTEPIGGGSNILFENWASISGYDHRYLMLFIVAQCMCVFCTLPTFGWFFALLFIATHCYTHGITTFSCVGSPTNMQAVLQCMPIHNTHTHTAIIH